MSEKDAAQQLKTPDPAAGDRSAGDRSAGDRSAADRAADAAAAVEAPPAPGAGPAAEPAAEQAAAAAAPVRFPEFSVSEGQGPSGSIDLLMDVDLEVKIELGRAQMAIEDVLKLRKGAVVELDKLAGDPVDILVNDRPIARGEILIVNDNFCVRVTEILDPEAGLKAGEKSE